MRCMRSLANDFLLYVDRGDAFDIECLKNIVTTGNYDAIINCIGLLNQFADSAPEKAVYINSYLPHQVVAWLKDTRHALFR